MPLVAEMLFHNEKCQLKGIVVEKDRLNDDLFTFSLVRGIEIFTVSNAQEISNIADKVKPDFCLMLSFGKKIPLDVIQKVDIYNIHTSYLPSYKGRHPTFWATVKNEKNVGISLHKVSPEIDEGEIVSRYKVPYYIWMNENSLIESLYGKLEVLVDDLFLYLDGKKSAEPNAQGDYYPPVQEADYTIDLSTDSPDVIYNKVRAQVKYRGARLVLSDGQVCWLKKIKFTKATEVNNRKFSEMYIVGQDCFVHYRADVSIKLIDYTLE